MQIKFLLVIKKILKKIVRLIEKIEIVPYTLILFLFIYFFFDNMYAL